jgi:hypothetical protein
MKAVILVTIVTLSTMSIFSGCDKPDYQDPRYRTSHK